MLAFEQAVNEIPNITEASRMMGQPDYLLRVVTADADTFETLYIDVLASLPHVQTLTSQLAMKPSSAPTNSRSMTPDPRTLNSRRHTASEALDIDGARAAAGPSAQSTHLRAGYLLQIVRRAGRIRHVGGCAPLLVLSLAVARAMRTLWSGLDVGGGAGSLKPSELYSGSDLN